MFRLCHVIWVEPRNCFNCRDGNCLWPAYQQKIVTALYVAEFRGRWASLSPEQKKPANFLRAFVFFGYPDLGSAPPGIKLTLIFDELVAEYFVHPVFQDIHFRRSID